MPKLKRPSLSKLMYEIGDFEVEMVVRDTREKAEFIVYQHCRSRAEYVGYLNPKFWQRSFTQALQKAKKKADQLNLAQGKRDAKYFRTLEEMDKLLEN